MGHTMASSPGGGGGVLQLTGPGQPLANRFDKVADNALEGGPSVEALSTCMGGPLYVAASLR